MRLDGFPASALAARAASSLCCCSFQRVRARTADRHPGHGGQGTARFWPGRHRSGPRDACQEQVQSGERLSGKTWGQGLGEQGRGDPTGQLQIQVRNKRQKSPDRAGSTPLNSGTQGPQQQGQGDVGEEGWDWSVWGRKGKKKFCEIPFHLLSHCRLG